MALNLTRAAGALASLFHGKATTTTIPTQLISVPARIASSARKLVLHPPQNWPWSSAWTGMFTAATGPPATVTTN